MVAALAMSGAARAQDATWLLSPGTNAFNTGANWSTGTVPTGTATFGASNTTSLNFNATTLGGITFSSVAPAYTLSATGATISFTGAGFTNNSGSTQTVNLDSATTLTFNNSSSAANVKINNNNGTLNFFDTSTASTSTIVNDGSAATLNFDDSASAGNATVTNKNGGTVCFCNDADPSHMMIFNGTGSTLKFQGNNASSQMRYVGQGGTFDITSASPTSITIGSIEGSGTIDLGSKTLAFGDNNLSTNFSGTITGTGGSLIKNGGGTLTLSGTNSYTGSTSVTGGKLIVLGNLTGSVDLSGSGQFQSSGTVGGNFTNEGSTSTVMLGSSIGTLTISGNFTQTSGIYLAKINGAGQSDLISVGGTASLAGSVNVQAAPGSYTRGTRYTIITSTGTLSGTFASVSSNFAFMTPALSYDSHNAFVTLSLASNAFAAGGQTGNQKAVGTALDRAAAGATGDFSNVINAIASLDTVQGPRALDAIAGQNYSGFSTVSVQTAQAFMNTFSQQAGSAAGDKGNRVALALRSNGDGDCTVYACEAPLAARWGAWGGGIAGAGTVAGDASAKGVSYSLGGFAAGLDYRFDRQFLAGVTAGYAGSTQYTQQMDGRGTSDTVQLALYSEFTEGAFYLDALAGYARSQNQMQRPLIIPGLNTRTAHGEAAANQFFGQLEAGYRIGIRHPDDASVLPFVRLQGSTSTQNAFSEWGADSLDLSVAQQTTNSLRTVTGAELDGKIAKTVDVQFRLGWSHEFADTNRPVTASFAGAPALSFTTLGAAAPRDGAVVGLGANTRVADATSLYARYDGEVQGGNTSHIFSAGLRMVW